MTDEQRRWPPLILKHGSPSRRRADYDVLENGVPRAVGPQGRPWMSASGHGGHIKRAAHGYAETREAAMAAFAKSWRKEWKPSGCTGPALSRS